MAGHSPRRDLRFPDSQGSRGVPSCLSASVRGPESPSCLGCWLPYGGLACARAPPTHTIRVGVSKHTPFILCSIATLHLFDSVLQNVPPGRPQHIVLSFPPKRKLESERGVTYQGCMLLFPQFLRACSTESLCSPKKEQKGASPKSGGQSTLGFGSQEEGGISPEKDSPDPSKARGS